MKTVKQDIASYLPAFSFLLIAGTLFIVNAFPSLYGDEYGSIFDSNHLAGNIHAIGYFSQLYLWNSISDSDWFLRLLSVLWFGAGLCWLNNWLKIQQISPQTRKLTIWLAVLNPFLWTYGLQIRFYAMFFASSILFVWRFRVWQMASSWKNLLYLLLSVLLLLTSHMFGVLVLATVLINHLWASTGKVRWFLIGILTLIGLIISIPVTRSALVWLVYRMSNPYAQIPAETATRGINVGMLAKVPLTLFFFTLGERVYPLWLWVTIPVMTTVVGVFIMGLWRLRRFSSLGSLIFFMLSNIPLLFLVLDPIAPVGLQGAASRYLIYVMPFFLLLLAIGAQIWKPLMPALFLVSLIGLFFLANPIWSYGESDLMNWPHYLREAIKQPQQSCVVTDGRAEDAADRYLPRGVRIFPKGMVTECLGYERIVLVSNDHRLAMVRPFDQMAERLDPEYNLVSNMTIFPAQITVYEKSPNGTFQFPPGRLDLPEQDLRFPIIVSERNWKIQGFARLDGNTPTVTVHLTPRQAGKFWILTNFRTNENIAIGTDVFRLQFSGSPAVKNVEMILHAGEETAEWRGPCPSCTSVYVWNKLFHLVGSFSYPGAYSQFQAHIWGFPVDLSSLIYQSTIMTVTYLPNKGTGYYFGLFPNAH